MLPIKMPLALSLALLSTTATGRATDIAVRVLSAKDGRPIVERRVQLYVSQTVQSPDQSSPQIFDRWEYTGADGRAIFHLGNIPPNARFTVGGAGAEYCSPSSYDADQVMRTGVAVERPCPHRPHGKFTVQARPGEIVIYSGECSRWERMLYFPWPG